MTTDQKSARVTHPDQAPSHVPNVYVTATAIRAITDNRLPLTVARGFVPLAVEKPGTQPFHRHQSPRSRAARKPGKPLR
ncbi:MAG: hypothetical protein WKG07_27580 [Hymenobacter sp.]